MPDTGQVSQGRVGPRRSSRRRRRPAGRLPHPPQPPWPARPRTRSPGGGWSRAAPAGSPRCCSSWVSPPPPARRRGRDSGGPGGTCHFPPDSSVLRFQPRLSLGGESGPSLPPRMEWDGLGEQAAVFKCSICLSLIKELGLCVLRELIQLRIGRSKKLKRLFPPP